MTNSTPEAAGRPWFAMLTTAIAIAASGLLALFGWHNLTGWYDFASGEWGAPERVAAFLVLALITVAAEFASARALIYWRQNESEGRKSIEERLSLFIFGACELVVVLCGAFGMASISDRMTAPTRVAVETEYREAKASAGVSESALASFETRSAAELSPARLAVAMSTGSMRRAAIAERDRIEKDTNAKRDALTADLARDRSKVAAAEAKREGLTGGLPWWLDLGAAMLLTLLKGALLFVATPRAARPAGPFTLQGIDRQSVDRMVSAGDAAGLDALATAAATAAALARHGKKRLESAA